MQSGVSGEQAIRFGWGRAVMASFAAVSVAGCGHADTAAERHMRDMRETIGTIQVEQDRTNQRLGLLEVAAEESREARASIGAPPEAGAPNQQPSRSTVQIGGAAEDAYEVDDPNGPDARPELRLEGSSIGSPRGLRGKVAGGRQRDGRRELSGEALSSVLDPEAKKSYEAALALAHSKQCDRALDALAAFLVRWPDHPYAENAMYWRGECYFARGEYLRAGEQFEGTLARFNGNKAPDALLKLGMCHERLGDADRAAQYWERLRREHPRSDAVKKIPSNATSNARGLGPKESR